MTFSTRDFQPADYAPCEALVNEAWAFDQHFPPQALADLAKEIYTRGALLGSNYPRVVEKNGQVVGFLFGYNELGPKPQKNPWFSWLVLWRLFWINPLRPGDKNRLLQAIQLHEKNRAELITRRQSEIVMFVIAKPCQGQGLGTALWKDFLAHCQASGVESIIVETNSQGASSYYQRLGFTWLGDFDSPLHAYVTPNGQAQLYEFCNHSSSRDSNSLTG